LKRQFPFATVAGMARPQASSGFAARAELRSRSRVRSRRLRRLVLAGVAAAILLPVLVIVFDSASTSGPVPLPQAERLLPAGPPTPQVVAFEGSLRIYLPIAESRVTAVGYHAVGAGALPLDPVGTQANAGIFTRLFNRLFGQDRGGIHYVLMGGRPGPETAGLDVGAPVGTDVYAPVDGTVIGISDRVVSGRTFGVRIDIQPSGSPGLVVSLTNLRADEALTVGSSVAKAVTKLGSVIDLSSVETPALARYTQDRGEHVHLEVRPTANLNLP
jgi:murein DD-endopeptidase MepM/ murein hydrolase activator NlpD